VVRVLGYRSGGPGSIPGTTRKKSSGSGTGPLSLVSTTEELIERNNSGSCLENREYGRRDPSCWPRGTLYPQKLAITSPTIGGRSLGIVEFFLTKSELKYTYCSQRNVYLNSKIACNLYSWDSRRALNIVISDTLLFLFSTSTRGSASN
jgi:hypothetical protein